MGQIPAPGQQSELPPQVDPSGLQGHVTIPPPVPPPMGPQHELLPTAEPAEMQQVPLQEMPWG
jgi:hypothetical protein